MQQTMTPLLHGETNKRQNDARIRRVLILFGICTALVAAMIVGALIWRDPTSLNNPNENPAQLIVIGITLVWGALLIFMWSMKLTPLLAYNRYLREIRSGLSRDVDGVVVSFDSTPTFRDGLNFYGLIVNVGDLADPEDERQLYWDVRLPRPGISDGDRVHVRAHGNDIIAMEKR